MILIVICKVDPASMNIQKCLLNLADWEPGPELFDNNPTYKLMSKYKLQMTQIMISREHLSYDNIDTAVRTQLDIEPECVIFASKHRSLTGTNTLSVHPIGNLRNTAELGGKPATLVPSAPILMTTAYRNLVESAERLGISAEYNVCFEATHHGPYLSCPAFYIEIGSDEPQWTNLSAGEAIAEAILNLSPITYGMPVALGVGGGHYAPRFSDIARSKRVAFGHIIPTYALRDSSSQEQEAMLIEALRKTAGVTVVYFHRKALKGSEYTQLKAWFTTQQINPVREDDLENL
jgi:D-aminoacyl-tRNA deacylase